jgi:hypothetical protein
MHFEGRPPGDQPMVEKDQKNVQDFVNQIASLTMWISLCLAQAEVWSKVTQWRDNQEVLEKALERLRVHHNYAPTFNDQYIYF